MMMLNMKLYITLLNLRLHSQLWTNIQDTLKLLLVEEVLRRLVLGLDRATQSTRQPGSTFKVLSTYAPAIDTNGIYFNY